MAEVTNRIFQVPVPTKTAVNSFPLFITRNDQWPEDMGGDDHEISDSVSTTSSSSFEDSNISSSSSSSSSLELTEDASSCLTSCSSFESSSVSPFEVSNKGPLYELSELMNQLPIKRGLSKHFQGKSQSFTSISNVQCIEDLAKKEVPFRKKMKGCKSYAGGGLDAQKSFSPKTCSKIKKASKASTYFSSFLPSGSGGGVKKNGFISGSNSRPPICVQKKF